MSCLKGAQIYNYSALVPQNSGPAVDKPKHQEGNLVLCSLTFSLNLTVCALGLCCQVFAVTPIS